MSNLILIIISGVLVNNFVMQQFLGICPFLGVSRKIETSLGMGLAVTFVMAIASLFTFIVQRYLLVPLNLEYMRIIAFVLVIAILVQIVEMGMKKLLPAMHRSMGVYLPLIATNCAVMGVTLNNTTAVAGGYGLIESVVNGVGGGLGFTLAIVAFAAIRERLEISNMPKWMDGFPGALIAAGLMSLSFQGFAGLI